MYVAGNFTGESNVISDIGDSTFLSIEGYSTLYVGGNAKLGALSDDVLFWGGGAASRGGGINLGNVDGNKELILAATEGHRFSIFDRIVCESASSGNNLKICINPESSHSGDIILDAILSPVHFSTADVCNGTFYLRKGASFGAPFNTGTFTLNQSATMRIDHRPQYYLYTYNSVSDAITETIVQNKNYTFNQNSLVTDGFFPTPTSNGYQCNGVSRIFSGKVNLDGHVDFFLPENIKPGNSMLIIPGLVEFQSATFSVGMLFDKVEIDVGQNVVLIHSDQSIVNHTDYVNKPSPLKGEFSQSGYYFELSTPLSNELWATLRWWDPTSPDPHPEFPESVPGVPPESMPESIPESIPESTIWSESYYSESMTESITESMPESLPESMTESVTESVPESAIWSESYYSESMPESMVESVLESASESFTESIPESTIWSESYYGESIPESVPESMVESASESFTESVPESTSWSESYYSESMPESVPESVTESMTESVPESAIWSESYYTESMSESVPESMTESLTESVPESANLPESDFGSESDGDGESEVIPESAIVPELEEPAAPPEGYPTGIILLNRCGDLIADFGETILPKPFNLYGVVHCGLERHRFNFPLEVGFRSLLAGFNFCGNTAHGRWSGGAFLESGFASFNRVRSAGEDFYAEGRCNSLGGGVLLRGLLKFNDRNHFSVEASGRAGRIENRWSSDNLLSFSGAPMVCDAASPYGGAHGGVGYRMSGSKLSLDLYGKYFWTELAGKSLELENGTAVEFKKICSSRARIGGRISLPSLWRLCPYGGAAWEREFRGEGDVLSEGALTALLSLRGNSAMGELGLRFHVGGAKAISVDVGLRAYCGARRGARGTLHAAYEF
jgi:hypothetical protein